jgi:hypothetical protein
MEQQITVDLNEAVAMLFEAHREHDSLRIQAAMRHLEFLDMLTRARRYEEPCQ